MRSTTPRLAVTGSSRAQPDEFAGPLPLLETKFFVPRWRSSFVSRPRLVDRIREGVDRRLTLVCAPAGFGKTTLLAEWLAGTRAAWVSLEPGDNDAVVFWSYVITSLQKQHPAVGARSLSLLQSNRPPGPEWILTALINDITALDEDVILVLDDYHVIDATSIHDALRFLLDHLPPRMRVVMTTRVDPPLPLAKLRAKDELIEVRAADLRFNTSEATEFLGDADAADVARLEARSEGWIAGLKLAALSLRNGSADHAIQQGESRHIADYLVDEVLQSEPEPVRRFLLDTAILDRLCGPLCDAILDADDSQARIESLERRNLFVVALDERGEWYRYHHLFADVLRRHANRSDAERVRRAHQRASAWYQSQGHADDAVQHAFAAQDAELAAALLELNRPENDKSYRARRWLDRVKSLPESVVRVRPVLTMGYAWGLLNSGELEAAAAKLDEIERLLEPSTDGNGLVVIDEARFRALEVDHAAARVYLAQSRAGSPASIADARRALEMVPPDADPIALATATALVALAHWAEGELEDAWRTFADALAFMRAGAYTLSEIRGIFVLGDIRVMQGRLRAAESLYRSGLKLSSEQPDPAATETDELNLGLSELAREWNRLDEAETLLKTIPQTSAFADQPGNRQRWCTSMARVREARGDYAGALDLLDEADALQVRTPLPRLRPIAAMKARVRIAQGRLEDALRWATDARVSIDDELRFAREYEHITLARLLIAQKNTDAAIALLDRLAVAARAGGRVTALIETLVLTAVSRHAGGNARGALEPLVEALALAEPEGFVRVFIDEGDAMRDLLRLAIGRGVASGEAARVLAALDERGATTSPEKEATVLTERELAILRLIASGMRNQQMAGQLFISEATVKRHVANIYLKLDVSHRTEALARARELRLL